MKYNIDDHENGDEVKDLTLRKALEEFQTLEDEEIVQVCNMRVNDVLCFYNCYIHRVE